MSLFSVIRIYCVAVFFALTIGNSALYIYSQDNLPDASRNMPLGDRHVNPKVNEIFKNNILLTLAYMSGSITEKSQIDWSEIDKPFSFKFKLAPGEVFAFHDKVLSSYDELNFVTTNSHFNAQEGFLSSGYLYGDGVCHLASLMSWTAINAGLNVVSPVNHDFAKIPDIPGEFGVSIYTSETNPETSKRQNLYIENNQEKPVILAFDYKEGNLNFSITK